MLRAPRYENLLHMQRDEEKSRMRECRVRRDRAIEELREAVVAAVRDGDLTIAEIAETSGYSRRNVRLIAESAGLPDGRTRKAAWGG